MEGRGGGGSLYEEAEIRDKGEGGYGEVCACFCLFCVFGVVQDTCCAAGEVAYRCGTGVKEVVDLIR